MIWILLIKERNEVLAVDLLQGALLAVVHHREVLVVVHEAIQGEWSTYTDTQEQEAVILYETVLV